MAVLLRRSFSQHAVDEARQHGQPSEGGGAPARPARRGGRPRRVAPGRPAVGSSADGPTAAGQGRETPGSAAWLLSACGADSGGRLRGGAVTLRRGGTTPSPA